MELEEFHKKLVKILVERRKEFGYSQESIAKVLGKNQVTIYNFEKCKNKLLIETAWTYCELLEITFDKVVSLAMQDFKYDDAIDKSFKDLIAVLQRLEPPAANKLAKAFRVILSFHVEEENKKKKKINEQMKTEKKAKEEHERQKKKLQQSVVKKRPGRPRKKRPTR